MTGGFRIEQDESDLAIEVAATGASQQHLVQAFGDCQAGRCGCPTNEYEKLAAMEILRMDNVVRLRLQPRTGETFDIDEIATCLDYTTAKVAQAQPAAEGHDPNAQ